MRCRRRKSFHAFFYDQAMYFTLFIFSPYNCNLRIRSIADPHFRTIEYNMVTGIFELCEHAARIAAMIRFCQPETPKPFAAGKLRQEFFSLFLASILIDREHD